jgi:ElaB/YqjD/DUF883 family membrane-anchored ribosome-binding protein
MGTKKMYEVQVETQLQEWCATVENMLAKANQAGYKRMIVWLERLVDRQSAAQQMLQILKQAGPETWETIKENMETMLTELRHEMSIVLSMDHRARLKSVGWAEGMADKAPRESIGWAEGMAEESPLESIGWAEGVAEEDTEQSMGWAEGYIQK